jgi:uroporphyrinogen-III synthase
MVSRNRGHGAVSKRAEKQLLVLQQISRYMAKDMPVHDVVEGIVRLVMQYLQCDSCFLYIKDGDELALCATHDRPVSAIGSIRLRLDEGLTGWVARERRLLALPREAFKDPRFKTFTNLPEDTFEAFLSAPVISLNQILGVINVQYRQIHDHSGDDIEFLTTVGELVGSFLRMTVNGRGPISGSALVTAVLGEGNGNAETPASASVGTDALAAGAASEVA